MPVVVNTCHGLWAGPGDPLAAAGGRARRRGVRRAALPRRALPERRGPATRSAGRSATARRRSSATGSTSSGSGSMPQGGRACAPSGGSPTTSSSSVGWVGASPRRGSSSSPRWPPRSARGARFVWVGPDDDDKEDRVDAGRGGAARARGRAGRHARRVLGHRRVRAADPPRGLQPLGHGGRRLRAPDGAHRHPRLPRDRHRTASTCSSSRREIPSSLEAAIRSAARRCRPP